MRMHQIEVDDDVYRYLKGKAEAFVDTPNTVLRRELFRDGTILRDRVQLSAERSGTAEHVAPGTPKALEQTLQVIHLVRRLGQSRSDATRQVATRHRVATQTVLDKYCRQLNLNARQFDRLLEQPDLSDLKALLNAKFSYHQDLIDSYLSRLSSP